MDLYSGAQCDSSIHPQSAASGQGARISEREDGRTPSHSVWRQPIDGEKAEMIRCRHRFQRGRCGRNIPGPPSMTLGCLPWCVVAEQDRGWLTGGPEVLCRSLGSWGGGDSEQSLLTYYWADQKKGGGCFLHGGGLSQRSLTQPVHPGDDDTLTVFCTQRPALQVGQWMSLKAALCLLERTWWPPLAALTVNTGTAT